MDEKDYQRLAYLRRKVPILTRELQLLEQLWAAHQPAHTNAPYTGKPPKGRRGGKHKSHWLTQPQVEEILQMHSGGLTNIQIARSTGWHPNTISDVVLGKKKGH